MTHFYAKKKFQLLHKNFIKKNKRSTQNEEEIVVNKQSIEIQTCC